MTAPSHHETKRTVVVTGAAGSLGRRLVARLGAAPEIDSVVVLDLVEPRFEPAVDHTFHAVDLATADLEPLLAGADQIVHLAFAVGPELDDAHTARSNVAAMQRLLEAAGAAGVGHVVIISSASVYGAWPGNPVPLTEEAPVRPNPGFSYAAQKAELERLAGQWTAAHPGTSVAVLRPAVALGAGDESWLARSMRALAGVRTGDDDPPTQFVHIDDLAAAVELACRDRLDGVYNVAADGWITAEGVRALAGTPPRIRVSEPVLDAWSRLASRWRLGRTPAGIVPYVTHPWVVANDRLEAAGWKPKHSNEEAFVEARPGTPWSTLSPKRRQELLLGAAGSVVVGAAVGTLALVRRRRRRG